MKLQLWRDGFGPGELDNVLARSKTIQSLVLRHLTSIPNLSRCGELKRNHSPSYRKTDFLRGVLVSGKTLLGETYAEQAQEMEVLVEEATIVSKSNNNDSDEESEDEFSSLLRGNIHVRKANIVKDIDRHIGLLMNFLPSLHHFLEYMRQEKEHKAAAKSEFTPSQAASAYISIVREKFTHAEEEIVERLGEANWQRHLNIRKKLEGSEQEVLDEDEEAVGAKSLFRPISTFQDSGLGTSIVAGEGSVASHSSFRTSATEGGLGSLRVPETPAEVHLGLTFKCHICGKILSKIRDRYQWKFVGLLLIFHIDGADI